MMKHKTILALGIFLAAATGALAQTLTDAVSLRLNKENGVYQKGEPVKIWADVKTVPSDDVTFSMFEYGNVPATLSKALKLTEGENLIYEASHDKPTHFVCIIHYGKNRPSTAHGDVNVGFIVSPESFSPGFTAPADLDEFWAAEIAAMRKMPIEAKITNDKSDSKYTIQEVEVNCVGPNPLRAYMAHPKDAKPHSLPIIIFYHSAGNPGTPATAGTARSYAEFGALGMDLNAHGMKNDMPKAYYDGLAEGELYGYSKREPKNRDDYYFKWMFLRAQRAIDYLTSSPLWDGKHIIVTGGSQGGAQSCFVASQDSRITDAVITVPAMLDQGAKLQGRHSSWPGTINKYKESSMAVSPYFDPSLMLHRTRADIWCEIGLYDLTCPAPNLFGALNQVSTEKVIVTTQRTHTMRGTNRDWHKPIDKMRKEYIRKALTK